MTRPTRIDQIIPSIIEHDAVSDHTFGVQKILRSMGFQSSIFANNIGPGTAGRVEPLAGMSRDDPGRWLLYQCSIGSPAAEIFADDRGTKLLDYHNITPATLVEKWLPPLGAEARLGRVQLAELAPKVSYAFADSAFNAGELEEVGYRYARVVPVLFERAPSNLVPDAELVSLLEAGRRAGQRHWLFVGQVGAHKAQHDIIKAFACYRCVFNTDVDLYLVGREMGPTYRRALVSFIEELGLSDVVHLTGSVSLEELAAYYASADVFVCCSDHEGFCVPIIEAMSRGVPVVAYGAAAVPGTVGNAGLLLADKSPLHVAAAVDQVLGNDQLRDLLAARGREQAARFSHDAAEQALRTCIEEALTIL